MFFVNLLIINNNLMLIKNQGTRIDGIETFLDHPNHDFLISRLIRKVVSEVRKDQTLFKNYMWL